MPYSSLPPTSTKSWRELVEKVDGEHRNNQSLYPVVYEFSGAVRKKDSGPASGIYAGS